MMRPAAPTPVGTLREGPPTRRDLASDTATPSSIEQHFVLQPILFLAITPPLCLGEFLMLHSKFKD